MESPIRAFAADGPLAGHIIEFSSHDTYVKVVRHRDGRIEALGPLGDKLAETLGGYTLDGDRAVWEVGP